MPDVDWLNAEGPSPGDEEEVRGLLVAGLDVADAGRSDPETLFGDPLGQLLLGPPMSESEVSDPNHRPEGVGSGHSANYRDR